MMKNGLKTVGLTIYLLISASVFEGGIEVGEIVGGGQDRFAVLRAQRAAPANGKAPQPLA